MTPNDLYAFLSDKRLVDLIERVKISDDFLDVVSLTETQHSDMLAWCLHPNEGHGQGDAVIRISDRGLRGRAGNKQVRQQDLLRNVDARKNPHVKFRLCLHRPGIQPHHR